MVYRCAQRGLIRVTGVLVVSVFFPPNSFHFHHFLKLKSFFFRRLPCAVVFILSFHCLSLCSQRSDLETPASFKQAISEEGGEKPRESAPPLPLPPPPSSSLAWPPPVMFRQHRSLDHGQAAVQLQLGSENLGMASLCAIRRLFFFFNSPLHFFFFFKVSVRKYPGQTGIALPQK